MIKPAIVAVGYNRPAGMRRLLDSIGKANFKTDNIPLIISIDESDKSNDVEKVAEEFEWKYGTKEIRRFPERQGLRKHIVQCGDISLKYGAVIILEDDLIVAEDFYNYVTKMHDTYSQYENICGISLYSYNANVFTHQEFLPIPSLSDVFLGKMVVTWGQSWTAKQWQNFKEWYLAHDGKLPAINHLIPRDISGWTRSWGRYFASYMAERELYYVYPYIARSTCFSDFGEHNTGNIPFTFVQVPLMQGQPDNYCCGDLSTLMRYDAFYEFELPDKCKINGIPANELCMDLNNMKTSTQGKRYVVTNSVLPYVKIASFGLSLRPIPQNVIQELPGNQINMYKLEDGNTVIRQWTGRRPSYYSSFRRMKYEYRDASWRVLLIYAPMEFLSRVRDVIYKKFIR